MPTPVRVILLDAYYAIFWCLLLREERYADCYGATLLKKLACHYRSSMKRIVQICRFPHGHSLAFHSYVGCSCITTAKF